MKLLLDECIPRKLKSNLSGHDCRTVPEEGWAGKKNAELLLLAEKGGFDAFLTLDRGIAYQQNLQSRAVAVVLIRTKSNRLADLLVLTPAILKVLRSAEPGQLLKVG